MFLDRKWVPQGPRSQKMLSREAKGLLVIRSRPTELTELGNMLLSTGLEPVTL